MFKKAISALLAIPVAVGFCTAGHRGKEPAVDHTERTVIVYQQKQEAKKDLGKFRVTFYTPYEEGGKWGYQTATGERSRHLATCAVDPSVIPLGSTIRITGNNGKVLELLCCDIGGGVRGKTVDVFVDGSQADGYDFLEAFGESHYVYLLEE